MATIEAGERAPAPPIHWKRVLLTAVLAPALGARAYVWAGPRAPARGIASQSRKAAATNARFLNLADEIEALRLARGGMPKDSEELEAWRGATLPATTWGHRIEYLRTRGGYSLRVCTSSDNDLWGDIYTWDSTAPAAGVKRTPF